MEDILNIPREPDCRNLTIAQFAQDVISLSQGISNANATVSLTFVMRGKLLFNLLHLNLLGNSPQQPPQA
jgi:hypothetical protein